MQPDGQRHRPPASVAHKSTLGCCRRPPSSSRPTSRRVGHAPTRDLPVSMPELLLQRGRLRTAAVHDRDTLRRRRRARTQICREQRSSPEPTTSPPISVDDDGSRPLSRSSAASPSRRARARVPCSGSPIRRRRLFRVLERGEQRDRALAAPSRRRPVNPTSCSSSNPATATDPPPAKAVCCRGRRDERLARVALVEQRAELLKADRSRRVRLDEARREVHPRVAMRRCRH